VVALIFEAIVVAIARQRGVVGHENQRGIEQT
jgi:hypothetical protein